MTTVDIQKVNGTTMVTIAGHSEFSNDHNDIVCAAASTLSQAFLNTLKVYAIKGRCSIISEEIDAKLGLLKVRYKSSEDEGVNALLVMLITGFSMLEKAYPKNIYLNAG